MKSEKQILAEKFCDFMSRLRIDCFDHRILSIDPLSGLDLLN